MGSKKTYTEHAKETGAPLADAFIEDLVNEGKIPVSYDQEPEGEVLASAANFWDFEKNPIFQGEYQGPEMSREAGEEGEIFAYLFRETGTKKDWLLGTNFLIEQSIRDAKERRGVDKGFTLWVKFIEKVQSSRGSDAKFSRFKIILVKEKTEAPVQA